MLQLFSDLPRITSVLLLSNRHAFEQSLFDANKSLSQIFFPVIIISTKLGVLVFRRDNKTQEPVKTL